MKIVDRVKELRRTVLVLLDLPRRVSLLERVESIRWRLDQECRKQEPDTDVLRTSLNEAMLDVVASFAAHRPNWN